MKNQKVKNKLLQSLIELSHKAAGSVVLFSVLFVSLESNKLEAGSRAVNSKVPIKEADESKFGDLRMRDAYDLGNAKLTQMLTAKYLEKSTIEDMIDQGQDAEAMALMGHLCDDLAASHQNAKYCFEQRYKPVTQREMIRIRSALAKVDTSINGLSSPKTAKFCRENPADAECRKVSFPAKKETGKKVKMRAPLLEDEATFQGIYKEQAEKLVKADGNAFLVTNEFNNFLNQTFNPEPSLEDFPIRERIQDEDGVTRAFISKKCKAGQVKGSGGYCYDQKAYEQALNEYRKKKESSDSELAKIREAIKRETQDQEGAESLLSSSSLENGSVKDILSQTREKIGSVVRDELNRRKGIQGSSDEAKRRGIASGEEKKGKTGFSQEQALGIDFRPQKSYPGESAARNPSGAEPPKPLTYDDLPDAEDQSNLSIYIRDDQIQEQIKGLNQNP